MIPPGHTTGPQQPHDDSKRGISKILFVDHTARMGGGEIALLNLVTGLDRTRFSPVVLLFSAGPLGDKLTQAGIETHVIPLSAEVAETRKGSLGLRSLIRLGAAGSALRFVWRVTQFIRRLRPALVHTNSLKADVIGGIAGRLAGVPVIWHVRDRIADDYLPPVVARVFRRMAEHVPAFVIANSNSTLHTLNRKHRDPAVSSRVGTEDRSRIVIYDGVDPNGAAVPPVRNPHLLVGLVGRITRWKGQHVFLEAVRLLHPTFPDARFQIIGSPLFGEDAYEAELRDTVARHGLQDVVEFTGFREDISAVIAQLDILVHASITGEPFGQVIIEGMVASKPVVATNGGGVPEIVKDGETGLLVPMGDAPAMAAAIGRLLADTDLRARMGQFGRARVEAEFSINRTVSLVQDLYTQLLAQPTADPRIGSAAARSKDYG